MPPPLHVSDYLFRFSDPVYHAIENFWKDARTQRRVANLLVWAFLLTLLLIEAARRALLPAPLTAFVPTNHFYAVSTAFTVLLGFEVLGLVFVLPQSISDSLGKQFEILSIILLRECFQDFVHFSEPIHWEQVTGSFLPVMANAFGGLLTFIAVGVFYRLQRHHRITRSPSAQERFRSTKRLLALALLAAFIYIAVDSAWDYLHREASARQFFDTFFTVLVFSDILLIFLSLRYSSSYQIVFRNSGFALATVFIRLSVTAPAYYNVALALSSALFAVCLTLAYNASTPAQQALHEEEAEAGAVGDGMRDEE